MPLPSTIRIAEAGQSKFGWLEVSKVTKVATGTNADAK